MFEKGQLVPDIMLVDAQGAQLHLWDFRNRSHLAILVGQKGTHEELSQWMAGAAQHQKTWDWLGVKFFGVALSNQSVQPGVYAIDRFGIFLNQFDSGPNVWNELEKEFLYYEAKHC
ncbi:MAG: hypothetical protein KCHDKBKB_01420 [Elusimicrobia bacterium]|nr:hypothetical protein [Elusimicrobiota bacterium]